MKSLTSLSIGIVVSVVLSACSSTGPVAPVDNRNQSGANGANSGTGSGTGVSNGSISERPPTANAGTQSGNIVETPVGKSVYFDYNQFTVKPEYADMLRQVSTMMKGAGKAPVKLEGNADERGSAEYNLALGQKRAEAVKKQLELLGVPEAQLEAVSFGSEKPRETCHAEKCWAANRRVDLMRQGR
jgi:peptidoglycan-associated lipoprotein